MGRQPIRQPEYDLQSVKLPRLSGPLLRFLVWIVEGPLYGLVLPSLLRSAGVENLRKQTIGEPPTLYPLHQSGIKVSERESIPESEINDLLMSLDKYSDTD